MRIVTLLAVVQICLAQADRGTLTGTVIDQGGAVVPGAKVTVRNPLTGVQFETQSTSTGNYSLTQLPSGGKYAQQGITVGVAQTVRVAA